MMMVNATAGLVSMKHGFTGASLCVSTACASGANAIGEGLRMIRDGSADVVVCGGTEAAITPTSMAAFARMGALSTRNDDPTAASRPFDTGRDGFVMGDGAGVPRARGLGPGRGPRAPRSTVSSPATAAPATPTTSPHPHPAASARSPAWSRRWPTPGSTPSAVTHINAHGTSTPLNDAAEAEAIAKVFGASGPPVTSTKGVTGHLVGAAGAVEAVIGLTCATRGIVPPVANLTDPDPAHHRRPRARRAADDHAGPGAVELVRVRRPQRHPGARTRRTSEHVTALAAAVPPAASPATPLGAGRPGAADAALVDLGGRTVAWFQVDSPSSADPDGTTEAAVVSRALALAGEVGVPAVGPDPLGRRRPPLDRGRRGAGAGSPTTRSRSRASCRSCSP